MLEVKEIVNIETKAEFINKDYILGKAIAEINKQAVDLCIQSMNELHTYPSRNILIGSVSTLHYMGLVSERLYDKFVDKIDKMLEFEDEVSKVCPQLCHIPDEIEYALVFNPEKFC